jgi:hypothetical protein
MAHRSTNQQTSWTPLLMAALAVCAMLLSLSSVILVALAMLPTLTAFIVDRTPQKYATFCVGGMNLSGTFPALLDLWAGGNDISTAMNLLGNVFTVGIIYGAAAFGWLVYMTVPPLVAAFLTMMAQRRVQQLRAAQAQLVEEWGDALKARAGGAGAAGPQQPS